MADFIPAKTITGGLEGLYSYDPNDPGGETWCGVSRVNNPNWSGWAIIDAHKKQFGLSEAVFVQKINSDKAFRNQFNTILSADDALAQAVNDVDKVNKQRMNDYN